MQPLIIRPKNIVCSDVGRPRTSETRRPQETSSNCCRRIEHNILRRILVHRVHLLALMQTTFVPAAFVRMRAIGRSIVTNGGGERQSRDVARDKALLCFHRTPTQQITQSGRYQFIWMNSFPSLCRSVKACTELR
jgi:hypothetical protein